MTPIPCTTSPVVRVAIDVAKLTHQVLLELPTGKRRSLRVANTKGEIDRFVSLLRSLEHPCEVALEQNGDYHRPHGHDAAVSGSARDRAPGSARAGEHLSAGLAAQGAPPAPHRDAPFALVFSRGGALSAQLAGRVVHRPPALHPVPHGGASVHEGSLRRRGARADRWPQSRQGTLAGRLLRHRVHPASACPCRSIRKRCACFAWCSRNIARCVSRGNVWKPTR